MRHSNFFKEDKNFEEYRRRRAFISELAEHPELMWAISSQRENKALGYCFVFIILNTFPTLVSAALETKATTPKNEPLLQIFRGDSNKSSIPVENLFPSSYSAVNMKSIKNTARKPQSPPQENYVLSPKYQQQLTAAHNIFNTIRKLAPKKYNLPDGATFNAERPTISYNITSQAMAEHTKKQDTLKTILQTTDIVIAAQKKVLAAELTRQALANPIMCKSQEEANAVNKEYNRYQNYLLRLKELMGFAETSVQFKGGTCGHQAALAVREILKKDIDIELISLKSAYGNHTFAVIGRDPNKKLDDPLNWNNDAIITDFWRYDRGIITLKRLKQYPQDYDYYFYKDWQWRTEKFSAQMPENLKGEFHKQYQQLREYFAYCQQKLSEIIHGDTVDLEATPTFKK